MSKHTPGPWQANSGSFHGKVYGHNPSDGPRSQILVADCWTAGLEERAPWRKDEAEANARLIAAAPDLLAACKAAMPLLGLLSAKMNGPQEVTDTMTLLSAAIDKAEGAT